MSISNRQWLIAFAAAVLLHGLLWSVVIWTDQPVKPPSDSPRGVMISLDDFAGTPPPATVDQQPSETSSTTAATLPEAAPAVVTPDTPAIASADIPAAASAPIGPEPSDATVAPDIADASSAPPPATDTADTRNNQSRGTLTAAVSVTPRDTPTRVSPTEQVIARDAVPPSDSDTQDTAQSANGAYGNSAQATNDYIVRLRAWLARHKQYPESARQAGQEGTVKLYLVVGRNGQVLEHRIVKSSGAAVLDQAANHMLARALPLPAMPAASHHSQLELVIPIVFTLH